MRHELPEHSIETLFERGWSTLSNGALLQAAEEAGFDVLVTTDLNLRYQQNLVDRRIAVVVLCTTSWPRIQRAIKEVARAIDQSALERYTEVHIP